MTWNFVIPGKPVSQKNARMIVKLPSGKRRPIPKQEIQAYRDSAVISLRSQWRKCRLDKYQSEPIEGDVCAVIKVYQGARQSIDLDNAISAPFDALQAAGILKNDYQIVSCIASRHRDNKNPRVEIYLMDS